MTRLPQLSLVPQNAALTDHTAASPAAASARLALAPDVRHEFAALGEWFRALAALNNGGITL